MRLPRLSVRDAVVKFRFNVSSLANGGGVAASAIFRGRSTGDHYQVRVRVASDRSVWLAVVRVRAGVRRSVGREVRVRGLQLALGGALVVRARVDGTNPVVFRARVWSAGKVEPTAWQLKRRDSGAALTAPGMVGVRAALAGDVTTTPIRLSVDNLEVVRRTSQRRHRPRAAAPTTPKPTPVPNSPYDAVFTGDATGATDVTSTLRAFLQSHDGQRVALAKNGIYRVTQLSFTATRLTVDFRGARLEGSEKGVHGILRIQSSSHIVLNDPKVYGSGYDWDSAAQNEHGIQVDGGSDIVLDHPVTRDTRGDGIYVGYQEGKNSPATGVVINDADIRRASRNGIAPVAGEVTIRGGHIADTGLHGIDFEVNDSTGASSIRGVVDGVDIRSHGDLPGIEPSSYAVAAGGYSSDTKPSVLVENVTGDRLRMTIRNTASVIVRNNVSDETTTADFPDLAPSRSGATSASPGDC